MTCMMPDPSVHTLAAWPGFFYLDGLPPAVLPAAARALEACKEFFRLPAQEKMRYKNVPGVQYRVRDPKTGKIYPVAGSGNGYRPAGGDIYFDKDKRESINFGRGVCPVHMHPPPPRPATNPYQTTRRIPNDTRDAHTHVWACAARDPLH
eukprot:SAG11_NODE_17770_length_509_cov_1.148780_1_plen_150_part_00